MSLLLTDEQQDLRRSMRAFLEAKSSESEVRRLMETDSGYDPEVWAQMATQLGIVGLLVPEEFGGAASSPIELAVVLEEMGRTLLCSPFFATAVLATSALLGSGDRVAAQKYLPGIAEGNTLATMALAEESGGWDEPGVQLSATQSGSGWLLNGRKSYVLDGLVAELILVAGRTHDGVSLFAVSKDSGGVTATAVSTLDQTRKLASLDFVDCPAELVGAQGQAWPVISHTLDLAAVALSAEMVGGSLRIQEMAVDYAKTRNQFGRPIGSFQAIKHKCADILLEAESAKSAADAAVMAAAQERSDLPALASLAKACCASSYTFVTSENIQVHGGIGFTWEHPAHLYYRRAISSDLLFGDVAYHRELSLERTGV